jgi:hypothetical protein
MRCQLTPAFSRWLKEVTSIDETEALPHQAAKIAAIQPVGWNAMLAASCALVCGDTLWVLARIARVTKELKPVQELHADVVVIRIALPEGAKDIVPGR